jgi:dihydrofolate synthase/folylpolyglutamate synthase
MTYGQTLDFLFSQLPAYTRVGKAAYKANLDNIKLLCEALGNPQHKFRTIHIAGTNGKGSTSHLLASVLQEAGYKTGLFTSPHLKDFRERIRIDGESISKMRVIQFVKKNRALFAKIKPSFFEMNVALAFQYFAEKRVDIAIIETGLGGRLDSTNLIKPELCVITNISFDHMDILGDTIEKIAQEKAGIIKRKTPIVISERQIETSDVFLQKASKEQAELIFAEDEISIIDHQLTERNNRLFLEINLQWNENNHHLKSPLPGLYQIKNLIGVLSAIHQLRKIGWSIHDYAVQDGIENVITNTGLRGRWDILQSDPLIIADTGHNEAGINEILNQLKQLHFNNLHWVWGMVGDKDVDKILSLLPSEASYYFCKAKLPRALDVEILSEKADSHGLKGKVFSSVQNALDAAKDAAKQGDMVLIGGSTFVVAEII